jgi:hypothetical protein
MANKKATTNSSKKHLELFFIPSLGVAVKAESATEAVEKAKKENK